MKSKSVEQEVLTERLIQGESGAQYRAEMTQNAYQRAAARTDRSAETISEMLAQVLDVSPDTATEIYTTLERFCYEVLDVPAMIRNAYNRHRLMITALGLVGEAGEFADMIKKHVGHGKPLDLEAAKKELGDVKWYGADASTRLGFTEEDVAQANIDKLNKRYPQGFNTADSIAKKDEGQS